MLISARQLNFNTSFLSFYTSRMLAKSLFSFARIGANKCHHVSRMAKFSSLDFTPLPDPPMDPLEETARTAFEKSCYLKIDWKVSEDAPVEHAISLMTANKIGCLGVTKGYGKDGEVIGVVSERDFIKKVALLGKSVSDTKISEICTHGANLVSVTLDNPVDKCMKKMLSRDIRHLLIREKETGKFVGMLSIKDLIKCVVAKHEAVVNRYQDIVFTAELLKQL